jgi:hypothetical protein
LDFKQLLDNMQRRGKPIEKEVPEFTGTYHCEAILLVSQLQAILGYLDHLVPDELQESLREQRLERNFLLYHQ